MTYRPNEELLFPFVDQWERLLLRMTPDLVDGQAGALWLAEAGPDDPIRTGFPTCPIHGTLLTVHGCQVCTD